MKNPSSDDVALAQKAASAMWERDNASRALGVELEEVLPGYARASLTIGEGMVNGHAIAHGGVIFMLADTAFAFACNARNDPHVALQCSISYVGAVRLGERVTAEARECSLKGRTGVYDVTLTRGEDEVVALFRGVCYRISGTVI